MNSLDVGSLIGTSIDTWGVISCRYYWDDQKFHYLNDSYRYITQEIWEGLYQSDVWNFLCDSNRVYFFFFCFHAETKRRRFHPLRGLRKIFRRKSRGAADLNANSGTADGNDHLISSRDSEEVTLRNPAGRPEESRSRSASELLTDPCDRERYTFQFTWVNSKFMLSSSIFLLIN